MFYTHSNNLFKSCLLLLFICNISFAAEYQNIENPKNGIKNGLLKDTWVLKYQEDDFSEKVSNASLIYIPNNYKTEKVFFMRCKDYFANFSVQYIDDQNSLKVAGRALPNNSPSFAKHGYIYDEKQSLTVSSSHDYDNFRVSVGGQNKTLTKLFKTDIVKEPNMLGMSFHYSFSYQEMPSFKAGKNSSATQNFFNILQPALANNDNITFELESDLGHKHNFALDIKRLNKFVPKHVMQYCFTGRELR